MKKYIVVFLMLSSFSLAGVGSESGVISQLYMKPDTNWVRVEFKPDNSNIGIKNPDGCESNSFYVVELDDSKSSDRFYSALLLAFASKETVTFWISGCSTSKPWGETRPKIYDIYL